MAVDPKAAQSSWLLNLIRKISPDFDNKFQNWIKTPEAQDYLQNSTNPTDVLSETFFGSPEKATQLPTLQPFQQQGLEQLLSGGLSSFQNPYQGWQGIEDEQLRKFDTEYAPTLARQYSLFGSNKTGSNLPGIIAGARTGLQSQLAALKGQYGQQQQKLGLQSSELGLKPSFQYHLSGGKPGIAQNALEGIGSAGVQQGLKALGWA